MLAQRRRRWANISPALGQRVVFAGYTLGHACSDVVSWGSENHVNQMACLTELELDVKEPRWT